jgi:hypothetical protein
MKIIATSSNGYLCEVSKDEMHQLTGREETYYPHQFAQGIGNTIKVLPLVNHIKAMQGTVKQREQAASILRSCAEIIGTVPQAFESPSEQPAQEQATS